VDSRRPNFGQNRQLAVMTAPLVSSTGATPYVTAWWPRQFVKAAGRAERADASPAPVELRPRVPWIFHAENRRRGAVSGGHGRHGRYGGQAGGSTNGRAVRTSWRAVRLATRPVLAVVSVIGLGSEVT
jgi:hypothetical protein